MKRPLIALLAVSAGLTLAAPAFAHSGEHSDVHLSDAVAHILHSPYHMAAIAAGVLIVAAVVWKAATRS